LTIDHYPLTIFCVSPTPARPLIPPSFGMRGSLECPLMATSTPHARTPREVDYIIVGSGAGGGPLAANLANAGYEVAVIEAGIDDSANHNTTVPLFHAFASEDPDLSWSFFANHYTAAAQRRKDFDPKFDDEKGGIFYPRCSSLGGCTVHNAMITIYPDNSDWDHIAEITGDSSWSARRMRMYFERIERCHYDGWFGLLWRARNMLHKVLRGVGIYWNPGRHGYDGWLQTETTDPKLAFQDAQLSRLIYEAAEQVFEEKRGPWIKKAITTLRRFAERGLDPNDWRRVVEKTEGLSFIPLATEKGVRTGPRERLKTVQNKYPARLHIETEALACRIRFENGLKPLRATAVEYIKGLHLYGADPHAAPKSPLESLERGEIHARREVILAAGAFNSPQLLMLSGIGPREELERCNISVLHDLPGVGRNLQDRYETGVVSEMKGDFAVLDRATFSPHPGDPYFMEWRDKGTGLYTSNGAVVGILKRSTGSQPVPDLFIFGLVAYFKGYERGYSKKHIRERNYFTWIVLKGHTHNRSGQVTIRSNDPRDVPDINFRYFDDDQAVPAKDWQQDLDAVVEGVEFVRRMNADPGLRAYIGRELVPGDQWETREKLREFIKREAWGHHASCTCKIGVDSDPLAVLDGKFRVRGTKNLRVVDASVFPRIPGLFIVSAVYMISEKASDVILDAARSEEASKKGR
jgi:choline dehydrogenase